MVWMSVEVIHRDVTPDQVALSEFIATIGVVDEHDTAVGKDEPG